MKRTRLFSVITFFAFVLATLCLTLNTNTKMVYAQAETTDEAQVFIQMYEENNSYIFSSYANIESVMELRFVVNGIKIAALSYEPQLILDQSDTALEVYAEADYYDDNDVFHTIKSSCITVNPATVNAEDGSGASSSTSTILFGGVLPAILAIGSVILLLYICFRKKIKPIDKVLVNLKSLDQHFTNTITIIKNEELKPKKKERLFKNNLKNIYQIISKSINIVISLNIESLGQYNSLLSNLIKFENIIKALSVSSANKDYKYKIKYLNKINKITLPVIILNAEEVQKTVVISENAKNSMFVQHTKSSQNLNTEDACEKYLSKTLYLYDDNESVQKDGEIQDD